MQLKHVLVALVMLISYHIGYSQIDFTKDPSSWPNPFDFSSKERIDAGYSYDKVIIYLEWKEKWRMEILPNLYIMDDQYEQVRKLFLPFYSFEEAWKQEGQFISLDSLNKLDVKGYSWMKQKLQQDQSDSPCLYLKDFFYNLYLVKINSKKSGALLLKLDCSDSILDDDEAEEYEIKRQGDSLIIIKFHDDDQN